MVCILNETSASDGDIFPYMFRQAGLGPLIGKRSWGGVVGITGRGPLIDGGRVFVPECGTNDVAGNWIIEGHGVDPDIVVENDPARRSSRAATRSSSAPCAELVEAHGREAGAAAAAAGRPGEDEVGGPRPDASSLRRARGDANMGLHGRGLLRGRGGRHRADAGRPAHARPL